ncbi:hypothetical protein ACQPZ8_18230 [Actinomadura nitritigenes]|uniref:hypothetical protein n=1 Tax=Actinomadura nitritigenes TaxID=134602 RepID=UPI003D901378
MLLAVGAAAVLVSSMSGCRVEVHQAGDTGAASGGTASGGAASTNAPSAGGSQRTTGQNGTGHNTTGMPGAPAGPNTGGTPANRKTTPASPTHLVPGIALSKDHVLLPCPSDGCVQQITIRSTGTAPLSIYTMVMLDDTDFSFGKQCVNKDLHPGETCTFGVTYGGPSSDQSVYTARLVIHQNLAGGPTYVALTRVPVPR